jgi:hypothetical protein
MITALTSFGCKKLSKKIMIEVFFRKLDPSDSYFWKWVPSVGRSGGILCGVKTESLEVSAFKAG